MCFLYLILTGNLFRGFKDFVVLPTFFQFISTKVKKEEYVYVRMSTQISLKLSDTMINTAKKHVEKYGYDTLQDFIRETLREKLFEKEIISGKYPYKASEKSLAKHWLTKEEDKAWKHLQEET